MYKHASPNPIDMADDVVTRFVNYGLAHRRAEPSRDQGRMIRLEGRELLNFGSYSYLGLDTHPGIRRASMEAVREFGTQFPCSRAYLSSHQYDQAEPLLEKICGRPVILCPSTTLAHLAFVPGMIHRGDFVILDQQVHHSVQSAIRMAVAGGVKHRVVRHNRMDRLEEMIRKYSDSYDRVWYMCDGIYSMYGDTAPVDELRELVEKFPKLHLYIDDAHGTGWTGRHGRGWILERYAEKHDRIFVALSLSKSFGACGGVLAFPNEETRRRVRAVGGPLIFAGQMTPGSLGAVVASAEFHLSDQLDARQSKLKHYIHSFHSELLRHQLPVISKGKGPIVYVGCGLPRVSAELARRMLARGFWVNPAAFPAVPMTSTGLRITLNTNLEHSDLKNLASAIADEWPEVLRSQDVSMKDVVSPFRAVAPEIQQLAEQTYSHTTKSIIPEQRFGHLSVSEYESVDEFGAEEWDKCFGKGSIFRSSYMRKSEETFVNERLKETRWSTWYFAVRDAQNEVVCATFFTNPVWKEDMLSPEDVSRQVETLRLNGKQVMTAPTLSMGSLATEGEHLFLDTGHADWEEALRLLLRRVEKLAKKLSVKQTVLRDIPASRTQLKKLFMEEGFLPLELPARAVVNVDWNDEQSFLERLSSSKRRHVRRKILDFSSRYRVEKLSTLDEAGIEYAYRLYTGVVEKNLALNTFPLPLSYFQMINELEDWEFLQLFLKDDSRIGSDVPVCVGLCHIGVEEYTPLFVGIDYRFIETDSNYRQFLFQSLMRARQLGKRKVCLGFTASVEKHRLGAEFESQTAFVSRTDSFTQENLLSMQAGIS